MSNGDGQVLDVVVLGAGLAGMTAAYELRDRDLVVLEREDRVGGRTLSGAWDGYWYNAGAQFVWDHRTLDLCRELGVEVLGADGADVALYVRARLVRARNPYLLLMKLPFSLREKIDFGWTIARLRRIASRFPNVDREGMDARPLSALVSKSTPITREVLDLVTETGAGVSIDEISGYIGLGYAIHLFGGDVNSTLKAVVGGTQQITRAMQQAVGPERVRLACEVESVAMDGDTVVVRYRRNGASEQVRARACIVSLPAGPTLSVVRGLPEDKRAALARMLPYERVINVIWRTHEDGPMPWDNTVTIPVLGMSFDQVSNNAFFLRRRDPARRSGGTLATICTAKRAEALWDLPDEEIVFRIKHELQRVFPQVGNVFGQGTVYRWEAALPTFRTGTLRTMDALRRPVGQIHFCGDYTAQPGTPGAVGSGHYAAQAVLRVLNAS